LVADVPTLSSEVAHVGPTIRSAAPLRPLACHSPAYHPSKAATLPSLSASVRVLRVLRKQRGFTQQQLADRFGIDRCYISEVENGRRSISLNILEVIADGFKISLPELFSQLD
jgi:DNA-binding XRE family transcriptional regulator